MPTIPNIVVNTIAGSIAIDRSTIRLFAASSMGVFIITPPFYAIFLQQITININICKPFVGCCRCLSNCPKNNKIST